MWLAEEELLREGGSHITSFLTQVHLEVHEGVFPELILSPGQVQSTVTTGLTSRTAQVRSNWETNNLLLFLYLFYLLFCLFPHLGVLTFQIQSLGLKGVSRLYFYFLEVIYYLWLWQLFRSLFHDDPWAQEGGGIMKISHLELSIPKKLTPYNLTSCGFLC